MKRNLSKKLFSITFGSLLALIAITFLFQLIFFQSFYEQKKIINLKKNIARFRSVYSFNLYDSKGLQSALKEFASNNSALIGIYSSNGVLQLSPYSDKNSENVQILNALLTQLRTDDDFANNILVNGQTEIHKFDNPIGNDKKIGVVAPMSLASKNDSIIIAVTSIQPIEEASEVIGEFYTYIFIGFIFISILLSSIYSKLISKPLIRMDKVATKMSNMDFSEKCAVDREDEIGSLARTLNFLSSNLENALNDLQEKNKKLEQDIEKERQLEVMRKDFVDSVSHELKTPIGIIEGYAEGIKDGIVSGDDVDLYLNTIIDESKKMSVLVSNMLELSRLESGVLKPNKETFNINRLIKKLVNKFSMDANAHNLNIYFEENTNYSYVNADIFQMEQVLTNIITNAIKYTPSGNDIIVSISEENNKYKISVINTGTKINDDELGNLFNKFYRVDKARKRNTNSTGLGLSIVKNILELHNYQYGLHNIDNGVEFFYLLDIVELEEDDE